MLVLVTPLVSAAKVGQVTAKCAWRSTTVSWRVEGAAASMPTVNTWDLDRSVRKDEEKDDH